VYDETLRLLASVDAFRGSIDDIHNRMGGQLEVALFDKTATNPKARIGEAIARFTEIAPEVSLAVHVGSINAIEQGVLEGKFQIGIILILVASGSFFLGVGWWQRLLGR